MLLPSRTGQRILRQSLLLPMPAFLQNGPAYCEAFLNVLRNVTKEEAVQYVLALIDDMLSGRQCHTPCAPSLRKLIRWWPHKLLHDHDLCCTFCS